VKSTGYQTLQITPRNMGANGASRFVLKNDRRAGRDFSIKII
jgi:hypothetical protein